MSSAWDYFSGLGAIKSKCTKYTGVMYFNQFFPTSGYSIATGTCKGLPRNMLQDCQPLLEQMATHFANAYVNIPSSMSRTEKPSFITNVRRCDIPGVTKPVSLLSQSWLFVFTWHQQIPILSKASSYKTKDINFATIARTNRLYSSRRHGIYNDFNITDTLWRESTGHSEIPFLGAFRTRELFSLSLAKKVFKHAIKLLVVRNSIMPTVKSLI